MAKSDYICRTCNEVRSAGYLKGRKYECPNHGVLCETHVTAKVLGSDKCKDCDSKVISYSWNFSLNEWVTL